MQHQSKEVSPVPRASVNADERETKNGVARAGERGINIGKDILEKAIKGGKSKSAKISRGIKGVRWKETDEKEDNNNTPAKKAKQGNETRKGDSLLKKRIFYGRQYCRMK